jgi:hypothetical protein
MIPMDRISLLQMVSDYVGRGWSPVPVARGQKAPKLKGWMREQAWKRIGDLYPQVDLPKEYGSGKATVIAWIWSRTVPSPDPAFMDVQVPIASSFLLSSKEGKEVWIEPQVDKEAKSITYAIRTKGTKAEIAAAKEGTKAGRGANFRCLMSNTAIAPAYVKATRSTRNYSTSSTHAGVRWRDFSVHAACFALWRR